MLDAVVSAYYTDPGRPLQIQYDGDGMSCEFTLMTVGARSGQPLAKAVPRPQARARQRPMLSQRADLSPANRSGNEDHEMQGMELPPASLRQSVELGAPLLDSEDHASNNTTNGEPSLFFDGGDDEEENRSAGHDNEDVLGWDVHMDLSVCSSLPQTQTIRVLT